MGMVSIMLVTAASVLALVYTIAVSTGWIILIQQQNSAYAQVIPGVNNGNFTSTTSGSLSLVNPDTAPSFITAVIVIGKDMQGNVTYVPNNVTVKLGEVILVLNNDTGTQSVTNGMGPDDPLAGKLFDTGPIPPRGFAEYVAANLSAGNYTFYSTNSTSTKGVLTVEPNN